MGRALVRRVFWRALLLALILAIPPSVAGENSKFHMFASVGTGETNGIYYPLGDFICGIVNQNLHESGIRCSREMTPGSVYNVEALRDANSNLLLSNPTWPTTPITERAPIPRPPSQLFAPCWRSIRSS